MKNSYLIKKGIHQDDVARINQLVEHCNQYDQTSYALYLEGDLKERSNDLLYYVNQQLLGYLMIIPSYKKGEIKIIGFVKPNKRNQGVFTQMLEEVQDFCLKENKKRMVFIIEQTSTSGQTYAKSQAMTLEYSTYKMNYENKRNFDIKFEHNILEIRKATNNDIDDMVRIGMEGFGTLEEEERPLIESNLKDPNRDLYVALHNNQLIGVVSAIKHEKECIICDLVVDQAFRRRGFGRILLNDVVQKQQNQNQATITLTVEAQNKNALSLYQSCGFQIEKATDFYSINL